MQWPIHIEAEARLIIRLVFGFASHFSICQTHPKLQNTEMAMLSSGHHTMANHFATILNPNQV